MREHRLSNLGPSRDRVAFPRGRKWGIVAYYEVIVQHSSGKPMRNQRVCLFGGGGLSSGFSDEGWTDDDGRVVLEHSASWVKVYVNNRVERDGVGPGRVVVTL